MCNHNDLYENGVKTLTVLNIKQKVKQIMILKLGFKVVFYDMCFFRDPMLFYGTKAVYMRPVLVYGTSDI